MALVPAALIAMAGLTQGFRHALEPDHLAAVSTFVSNKRSPVAAMRFAAAWGMGHAATLVLVGGALFVMRSAMPAGIASVLEGGVAIMLVVLGVRAILQAKRLGSAGPEKAHSHGSMAHEHAASAPHIHLRVGSFATLPFVVGLVHGLAGSGALASLVMGHAPSVVSGIVFLLLYGLGATASMAALAGLLAKPLSALLQGPRARIALVTVSGIASLGVGVVWGALVLAG
jgi:high-affinity nickel-transport protein